MVSWYDVGDHQNFLDILHCRIKVMSMNFYGEPKHALTDDLPNRVIYSTTTTPTTLSHLWSTS
jgi:hypothetical protein